MEDGVCLRFDVEDEKDRMLEREFIKELIDEEENKLYDYNPDENFFSGEGYQALIKECGLPSQDIYDQETTDTDSSDFPSYKNIAAKMTDISDGQKLVFKRLISKGEGSKAPEGSLVIYNYKFYYEPQPEPFDSTRFKRRPDRQRVGVGQLLPGIDCALQSMCRKERANFIFDSSVMFGALGVPPRIPGGVDIYAEIEVIDFTEKNLIDDFFEKTVEERLELSFADMIKLVVQCRDDANVAVRDKRFGGALNKYQRGLDILFSMPISTDEEERVRAGHVSKLHLNMAHCNLKLNRGPSAIKCCNAVLSKQPHNVKALYRKGKGLMIIGEFDDAARFLKQANKNSPNNKEILDALADNEDLKQQYYDTEKLLAQTMLQVNIKEGAANQPKIVRTPDLNCELANDLRQQIRDFVDMEDNKILPNLNGLSTDEILIVKGLCLEHNLHFNEKDGVIRKKLNL